MAKIKEWNKCENCVHSNVCEFRTSREECVRQMNGKLDNLGYMTDFFVFSFECKEYIKREPTRKDVFERCFAQKRSIERSGRWNIIAKNKNNKLWTVCDYNLTLFDFIVKRIYCMFKYEVVELGKYAR